jgi:hypothetical protein
VLVVTGVSFPLSIFKVADEGYGNLFGAASRMLSVVVYGSFRIEFNLG